ncbi:MAG: PIN domain-containing protein [Pseudohongiellaceae bacterium]
MTAARIFLDSNVLLYLQSADETKANRAEVIASAGGVISIQVLNEITYVMRRKFNSPWVQINEVMESLQRLFTIEPVNIDVHLTGRRLAERYGFNFYDATIVASALLAGCELLYSEDMHDGLLVEDRLRISNPFANPGL